MSAFLIETYVVRTDMQPEFMPLLDKFLTFKRQHPGLFVGLKSWHLYKQEIGTPAGMYVEMWEFESLAEMDEVNGRVFGDPEMKAIQTAFHSLVEPATFNTSIWRPVA